MKLRSGLVRRAGQKNARGNRNVGNKLCFLSGMKKQQQLCPWSYICRSEMDPDCAVALSSPSAADLAQTLQIHLENL